MLVGLWRDVSIWENKHKEMEPSFISPFVFSQNFLLVRKMQREMVDSRDELLLRILRVTALKLITKKWLQR